MVSISTTVCAINCMNMIKSHGYGPYLAQKFVDDICAENLAQLRANTVSPIPGIFFSHSNRYKNPLYPVSSMAHVYSHVLTKTDDRGVTTTYKAGYREQVVLHTNLSHCISLKMIKVALLLLPLIVAAHAAPEARFDNSRNFTFSLTRFTLFSG